jgi:hypothetical protein
MDKQDDQARDRLTQQRHHQDHTQETMLERSDEELHEPSALKVEEKARLAMANQLHHQDHTQDAMLERSEEELH